jgi:hypothetical protein
MDISNLVSFLSPFLPDLLKLGQNSGETAVEAASKKFGEAAWNKAQAIWEQLQPKVKSKGAAAEAVEDVAESPEDEDLQAALRVQLKKLLQQDEPLWGAIAAILKEDASDGTPGVQIVQNVTGNRNQIIGQVSGGTVSYKN